VQQGLDFANRARCLALVRVLIARQEFEEAHGLLSQLVRRSTELGWRRDLLEARVLQSLTYNAEGESDLALDALERALALGYPEGCITVFAGRGEPMARMLYAVTSGGSSRCHQDYAGRTLAAFPSHPFALKPGEPEGVESLTQRELDVLGLLAQGLTNQQIADGLFIALATVKTHTRSIYGKLGVNNRTRAVNRARVLGILPHLH